MVTVCRCAHAGAEQRALQNSGVALTLAQDAPPAVQHVSPAVQVAISDALVDIDRVTAADITLIGYEPHGKLDMTMAV